MNTALAGKDVSGEVTFLALELKAPVIAATFTALGDQAREQGWSHEEYLAAVLGRPVSTPPATSIWAAEVSRARVFIVVLPTRRVWAARTSRGERTRQ
jgi:hypothetical protein